MHMIVLSTVAVVLAACGGAPEAAPVKTASPEPATVAVAPGAGTAAGAAWARVLAEYQVEGGLRYAALKADSVDLETFLASLPAADPSALGREDALAFWINAYNGLVIQGVLERYPGLESVIEVEGFFDGERHAVAGEELTLNEIERRALDLGEPRVHFAVVCASEGCPDLRGEPYRGGTLESQLEAQTASFLADESKGLRYDEASGELWLSSIFDWYAKDFGGDVLSWLLPRLPEALAAKLRGAPPTLRFIEYSWSPNDRS
jgi:Protein of unknown function, DUF547